MARNAPSLTHEEAIALIADMSEFIELVSGKPRVAGIVLKTDKEKDTAMIGVEGGGMRIYRIPEELAKDFRPGTGVEINLEGALVDVREPLPGSITTVISDHPLTVRVANEQKVVAFFTKDRPKVADEVLLDFTGHAVLRITKRADTGVPNVEETRFSDVAGYQDQKELLTRLIQKPLSNPELARKWGIKPPKGILLYGPPGTGKTLIVKALAWESGVKFRAIKSSELVSPYYGETEQNIRSVFMVGELTIIFFDEADSLLSARGHHISEVSDRVVNAFLKEMENPNVITVLCTNRPDLLDDAVVRPGRIDYHVNMPRPDQPTCSEILQLHASRFPIHQANPPRIGEIVDTIFPGGNITGAVLASIAEEAASATFNLDIDGRIEEPSGISHDMLLHVAKEKVSAIQRAKQFRRV